MKLHQLKRSESHEYEIFLTFLTIFSAKLVENDNVLHDYPVWFKTQFAPLPLTLHQFQSNMPRVMVQAGDVTMPACSNHNIIS